MPHARPSDRVPSLTAALVAAVAAALAAGVAVGDGVDPHRWTPDDIVRAETATEWTVSRDGALAAWVKSTVETRDATEKRVSNLWLSRLATATSSALTRGQDTVNAPAFSPDGATVAFLSTRPVPGAGKDLGATQVWAIPAGGGEAYPVTRFDRSVRAVAWTGDRTLLVAAQESPSQWELERTSRKDDAVFVDDAAHEPPVRLFAVALDGGAATRVTRNRDWIDALAVAPDGAHAVITAQQSLSYEFDQRVPPRTFLVDLPDGALHELFADGRLRPSEVAWAPDGRSFYFANGFSRDPVYRTATITELWCYDLGTGHATQVELDWPRGLGRGFAPVPDGVLALLADGVRFRAARLDRGADGWTRTDLAGDGLANVAALAAAADGRTLVYARSSAVTPEQWYAASLAGAAVRGARALTDLNPGFTAKPTGKVEVVRWKGARDEEVEGLLHYPLDFAPGRRYPLILAIHGGPTGADMDLWRLSWATPIILWRQAGAFVLQVNYHGSTGYGLDWVESIGRGRYYELEIPDIERGVDAAIARGLVDPDRLATAGWSNGGILSAELITRTRRYRAASIGAADVEWFSDWANVDFGASFDNYYFGGAPWEVPQVYMAKSPFFRLTEVTTPVIAYTGTVDRNVPPHESWSLFRALQQIGKAPVRLVLFPGEPHGLREIVHQRTKIAEDLAWFDRYLFGRAATAQEAVKTGSPLAALLARSAAARQGSRLGALARGVLVPETAPLAGLEVGRFEVTRAQFAAFDRTAPAAPGDENLPAAGVPFERARAYAAWLAARTGRPFRLPTVAEAERLAAAAGTGGNTLDRWAGYAPNPDDAAQLRETAARLGGSPLLLPVGSVPGCGTPAVFDLDGNAAEWAVAPDGAARPAGPSADRPGDPRSREAPDPAYVGFRVVVDPRPER